MILLKCSASRRAYGVPFVDFVRRGVYAGKVVFSWSVIRVPPRASPMRVCHAHKERVFYLSCHLCGTESPSHHLSLFHNHLCEYLYISIVCGASQNNCCIPFSKIQTFPALAVHRRRAGQGRICAAVQELRKLLHAAIISSYSGLCYRMYTTLVPSYITRWT